MAKRTPSQVYASLIAAGFDPAGAATMTAIAGAESGYDTTALGDVNLQSNVWGPSYGLFQVRTVKPDTGRGTARDVTLLSTGDAAQAKAAYQISQGGRDFSPWSVYTSGRYQSFLPAARAVADTGGAGGGGPFPTWGPDWLPWNWPSAAANATAANALGGARSIAVEAVFVVLGLALVGAGAFVIARPDRTAVAAAKLAGKVL